jgi:Na+-driven multidrug efflux pump
MKLWGDMLTIGLPAGAEFALMAAFLLVVYAVSRPFGAAAQAGFGIGMRIVQAAFLPVVALGTSVAPVAGQNFGARRAQRVRDTFRSAAMMVTGYMFLASMLCLAIPTRLIGIFSDDPQVLVVGNEYLRIVAWNFVASGIIFVASSMFQAMGNTIPPLMTSIGRMIVVTVPVVLLPTMPGFALSWVWYLALCSTWLQLAAILMLLRREFGRRLTFEPAAA